MTEKRLDRVFIFGDKLSFLIPHEWAEESEESNNYLYHAPNADSGWFRVSLVKVSEPGKASREYLRQLFEERSKKEQRRFSEHGDNLILAWEQMSSEDGVPICNFWWAVAHSHGPNLGREALFSYTVLRERCGDPETSAMLSLISELVADARFVEPKIT